MVQGQGRTPMARPLIRRLGTAELVEAFLVSRRSCAPKTRWQYRWALRRFERAFAELPRDPVQVVQFVLELPQLRRPQWGLGVMSMRSYHKVLRTFYAWAKRERDPRLPSLPYEGFGKRRRRGRV